MLVPEQAQNRELSGKMLLKQYFTSKVNSTCPRLPLSIASRARLDSICTFSRVVFVSLVVILCAQEDRGSLLVSVRSTRVTIRQMVSQLRFVGEVCVMDLACVYF